jgi:hypothetical protein
MGSEAIMPIDAAYAQYLRRHRNPDGAEARSKKAHYPTINNIAFTTIASLNQFLTVAKKQ